MMMESQEKLILAVVGPENVDAVMESLTAHQYEVTRLSSTGGFLRRGSVTLIVGVEEADLESALDVIRFACRNEPKSAEHKATLFVVDAGQFLQI